MENHIKNLLACAIFLSALTSCGGKTRSSQTTINIIPNQPIVITGNLVTPTITYTAPWFQFNVSITNNSDLALVIVGINVYVTATIQGAMQNNTVSFAPAISDFTDINTGVTCTYTTYGTIPANSTGTLIATAPTGSPAVCTPQPTQFIVSNNPVDPTQVANPTNEIYNYNVEVIPEGWFGTATSQQDRFDAYTAFTTQ